MRALSLGGADRTRQTAATVAGMNGEQGLREALRRRPMLTDVLLAVALFATEVALVLLGPRDMWPGSWPLLLGWHAIGAVPVAMRRRLFWPAVVVLTMYTTLPYVAFPAFATGSLGLVVLTYTAAAWRRAHVAALATVVMWTPPIVCGVLFMPELDSPFDFPVHFYVAFNVMFAMVCYLFGRAVHNHRAYAEALRVRAQSAEENQ